MRLGLPTLFALIPLTILACGSDETNTVPRREATAGKAGAAGNPAAAGSSGAAGRAGASATAGQGGTSNDAGSGGTTAGSAGLGGAAGAATAGNAGAAGTAGQSGAAGLGGTTAGAAGSTSSAGAAGIGGVGGSAGSAGNGASGEAGAAGTSGAAGAGGSQPACVKTEAVEVTCNNIDDDCNGRVDDVDLKKDGFCDCLRIGIIGAPGNNASASFQTWLTARGTTVKRIQQDGTGTLDATVLADFDVVVLDQLARDYATEEASALRVWVEKGGGFMTMTGYTDNQTIDFRANSLLGPFGLAYSYDQGLINGPITTFQTHPVTTGLTSVTFLGGYHVTKSPSTGTSTLLGTINGIDVAYAHEQALGHGVVWGDEWIQFDSEWSSQPQIEKLWENIFVWVGPRTRCLLGKD